MTQKTNQNLKHDFSKNRVAKLKRVQYEIPLCGPFHTILLFDGRLPRVSGASCTFQLYN